MNKSKLFLIIFLISILMVGPIIMAKTINKERAQNVAINENIRVSNLDVEKIPEVVEVSDLIKNQGEFKVKEEIKPKKEFEISDKTYFDDALFIGDSRTVGIMEYGNLNNATFFCNTGLSVYNVRNKVISSPKIGKLTLDELLSNKQFGKIYIMLGINELGYDTNQTLNKYTNLVKYIQEKEPNALIFIEGNLHVTKEKSDKDKIINNRKIDYFNESIKKLADSDKIFYIDINEKFNDGYGNLPANYTGDQVHIYAKHYKDWSNWLLEKTIKGEA